MSLTRPFHELSQSALRQPSDSLKLPDTHEDNHVTSTLYSLGLSHLIGTSALKPYMHGYFLSLKLYTTARLISNPQSYTEHRDRLVTAKLAAQAESRIRARKDQPKVNKALAERVRKNEEREAAKEKKRAERMGLAIPQEEEGELEEEEFEAEELSGKKRKATNILTDPRFKELWENPDFEVDEESREFGMLNPATANNNAKRRKTAVEEEAEESDRESSDGLSHSEDESEEEEDDKSDDSDDAGGEHRSVGGAPKPRDADLMRRVFPLFCLRSSSIRSKGLESR